MSKAGKRIIAGLNDAIAWSKGDISKGRLIYVEIKQPKIKPKPKLTLVKG